MAKQKEGTWYGAEQLRPLLVPVGELQEYPGNPRRGNVELVTRSLDEFGQQKPIVVQASSRSVVAGNHTLRAVTQMGWTHIAAVVEEMDDDTARDYLLADNKSSDEGSYDDSSLTAMLKDAAEGGRLDRTLYSGDELDDLLARQGVQETEKEEFKGGYAADDERWKQTQDGEPIREGSTGAVREVRLVFNEDEYAQFGEHVRKLRAEWGTGGLIETVFRAVSEAAAGVES